MSYPLLLGFSLLPAALLLVTTSDRTPRSCLYSLFDGLIDGHLWGDDMHNYASCHHIGYSADKMDIHLSKASLEPIRLGIQQIDKSLWLEQMEISTDWIDDKCPEPPSFEFGTESCVIETTATTKISSEWGFTATPKKGCDYMRKMVAEQNKTVTSTFYKFHLDLNATVDNFGWTLYEWDFDPDMDHRWPDFFIRKTKEGNCSNFEITWDCRRPIF